MKVLVTGANGQLGHDVVDELRKRNHEAITTDIAGDVDYLLDITNESVIKGDRPRICGKFQCLCRGRHADDGDQ